MLTQGTFDEGISLAKGIIFTKIGLANGYILEVWAAHPTRNLAESPPPRLHPGGVTLTYHLTGNCHFAEKIGIHNSEHVKKFRAIVP